MCVVCRDGGERRLTAEFHYNDEKVRKVNAVNAQSHSSHHTLIETNKITGEAILSCGQIIENLLRR